MQRRAHRDLASASPGAGVGAVRGRSGRNCHTVPQEMFDFKYNVAIVDDWPDSFPGTVVEIDSAGALISLRPSELGVR